MSPEADSRTNFLSRIRGSGQLSPVQSSFFVVMMLQSPFFMESAVNGDEGPAVENFNGKFYPIYPDAGIAQLVELLFCKQEVAGSSPAASTILFLKRFFLKRPIYLSTKPLLITIVRSAGKS